jgi:hypothetical protein
LAGSGFSGLVARCRLGTRKNEEWVVDARARRSPTIFLPVQLWNFFPDFRGTNIILPLTALQLYNCFLRSIILGGNFRGSGLNVMDGIDFRKNKNRHKNDIADYASAFVRQTSMSMNLSSRRLRLSYAANDQPQQSQPTLIYKKQESRASAPSLRT